MTTRLSNMMRGVLKTFGLLPGAGRGLRFDRRVEALLEGAPEIGLIVRPLLTTWRQLREQQRLPRRQPVLTIEEAFLLSPFRASR